MPFRGRGRGRCGDMGPGWGADMSHGPGWGQPPLPPGQPPPGADMAPGWGRGAFNNSQGEYGAGGWRGRGHDRGRGGGGYERGARGGKVRGGGRGNPNQILLPSEEEIQATFAGSNVEARPGDW